MRNRFLLACLMVCAVAPTVLAQTTEVPVSASAPAARYTGGDGVTIKKAIVIDGVRNLEEGLAAEQEWIRRNLPGAVIESRGRVTGPPHYDVLTVKLASGNRMDVHFDISAFYTE